MKVVILCGGKGTRLREETEFRPKPMVPIGNKPILWHIMKSYAHYGHKEFILCLGYKGEMIKEFFRNYLWNTCDITLTLGQDAAMKFHDRHLEEDWTVTLADTGEETMTSARVRRIQRYIPAGEPFLLTYGDGLSTIDINASIAAHHASGKTCTITAVHPAGRFGSIRIEENNTIKTFKEKPQFEEAYINGGYMVCSHSFFDYLPDDPTVMLERKPMDDLVRDGQLNAFKHEDFWQPMGHLSGDAALKSNLGRGPSTVESLVTMPFGDIYRGRRVLLTGHTGFKGSWLAEWLLALGAEVTGLSLPPPTDPALFDQLKLADRVNHRIGDIRDLSVVRQAVDEARPDFVFHLAAQPLVRLSYSQPVETYATNVLGTVHVMEAVRLAAKQCTMVCISTDKCYENREWVHSYREEDALGGHDPYSSSKGAAEIAINAYRRSYFSAPDSPIRTVSARAGNVIGGGDWALDRIMPDCIRALANGESVSVRNKVSTRPWQHVLEPLSGYLQLGAAIHRAAERNDSTLLKQFCSAYNFGPALTSNRTVADLVEETLKHWPGAWDDRSDPSAVHEATLLNLATDKAHHFLGWRPVWDFAETIARTVSWYRKWHHDPIAARELTRLQISEYTQAAAAAHIPWAIRPSTN